MQQFIGNNTQPVQNYSQNMTQGFDQQQNYQHHPVVNQNNIIPHQQNNFVQNVQHHQQIYQPTNQLGSYQQMQQLPTHQNLQQDQQQSNHVIISNNNYQMPTVETIQRNQIQYCIRSGCLQEAIVSIDWEDEYCSNECLIMHCRDVFSEWAQNNANSQQLQNFPISN